MASHAQGLEGSRFTRWQVCRLLAGGSRERLEVWQLYRALSLPHGTRDGQNIALGQSRGAACCQPIELPCYPAAAGRLPWPWACERRVPYGDENDVPSGQPARYPTSQQDGIGARSSESKTTIKTRAKQRIKAVRRPDTKLGTILLGSHGNIWPV